MNKIGTLAAVLAFTVVSAGTAQAQRFGVHFNWGDDTDAGIGVRGEMDLPNTLSKTGAFSRAFLIGQFDYYFPDCGAGADCTYWELNPSLAVPFKLQNSKVVPYAGAGLHLSHYSVGAINFSDTGMGLNLLGGVKIPAGTLNTYLEGRLGLGGDYEQFALSVGLLFGGAKK